MIGLPKFIVRMELDLKRVERAVAAKQKRVLFKQGRYLKTSMQRSMRYGGKRRTRSKPGEPPRAHKGTGAFLRKLIRFDVDLRKGSVICGPPTKPGSKVDSTKPLPELLNEGGDVRMLIRGQEVSAHIEPRPFTAPVFTDGGNNFRKLLEKELF